MRNLNIFCNRGGKTARHPRYSELKAKEMELQFNKKDLQRQRAAKRERLKVRPQGKPMTSLVSRLAALGR